MTYKSWRFMRYTNHYGASLSASCHPALLLQCARGTFHFHDASTADIHLTHLYVLELISSGQRTHVCHFCDLSIKKDIQRHTFISATLSVALYSELGSMKCSLQIAKRLIHKKLRRRIIQPSFIKIACV